MDRIPISQEVDVWISTKLIRSSTNACREAADGTISDDVFTVLNTNQQQNN